MAVQDLEKNTCSCSARFNTSFLFYCAIVAMVETTFHHCAAWFAFITTGKQL